MGKTQWKKLYEDLATKYSNALGKLADQKKELLALREKQGELRATISKKNEGIQELMERTSEDDGKIKNLEYELGQTNNALQEQESNATYYKEEFAHLSIELKALKRMISLLELMHKEGKK